MESKINKNFCIQPFVNVTTRVGGQNNICCAMVQRHSNIQNESPHEFFNSKRVQSIREKFLKGETLDACKLCHFQEAKTNSSARTVYNNFYKIDNNQPIEYYEKIIDRLRLKNIKNPLYAEVHISNLCNLKCLSCNEADSSKFHAENKALGVSENPEADYSTFDKNKIDALNSIIHDNLLFLDIRGGETLMVPEVKKILNEISPDKAKKITLRIQTNGTIKPDQEWIQIFKKFKREKLTISIDAYGNDNHYVRYPSNWKKIMDTLTHLEKNDVHFSINTVVSNLNLLVLDKLFAWIQEKQYHNYFYVLESPSHYRPDNLPQSLLDIASERLQNVKKDFVNKDCNEKLDELIEMCKSKSNTLRWQTFCKEIAMRDKYRKNSITSVMPQIKEYMNAKV